MKSIITFIFLITLSAATMVSAQNISEQYLVAGRKLELRSGPGLNYNAIGEIPQGTQVYVISSGYGEWSTVQYKRNNGFVLTNALTKDNRIADAERAAREAAAKREAAKLAAAQAIAQAEEAKRAAEEAARRAIADAERLKREAQAEAAKAIADAEAAKKNKDAAARRAKIEAEETRIALIEANKRAKGGVNSASTPIESNTPSYGSSPRNSTKKPKPSSSVTKENKFTNWERKTYKSGAVPKSFGKFKGKYDYKFDNYLKINVGKNTDVVVKLIKMGKSEKDDQTVRVAYINSNSVEYLRNIPEGEYYCVIAYGKEWKETTENGRVLGSFTKNALYEKGQDILNFKAVKTANGINVPSFTLSLDLLPNGTLGYDGNEDNIDLKQFQSY